MRLPFVVVIGTGILTGAFCAALLSVGPSNAYGYLRASLPGSRPSFDAEVRYTASGFEPRLLEVPIGARVVFRNDSGARLWVASDPYPARTDYPEFDAGRDYQDGEVYLFTFTRSGTFSYHNQSVPIDTATIRVMDPAHPIPDLSKTQKRQQAVRDTLIDMLVPGKPDSIFLIVDALDADPVLSLDCHDIAHDAGHEAYELYGFSGAMTYSNPGVVDHASVMDICAGGYVHGVLEEASIHDLSFAENPGALCAGVPTHNKASCYHGVGHALMFFTTRDIEASLAACRTIGNPDANSRCFEGVWMEAFWGNTEHAGSSSLGWDVAKPLAPCQATALDSKPACFLYASFGYLRTHVKDHAGAVRLCSMSALSVSDESFCLKGVGITMLSRFKASALERTEPFVAGLGVSAKHGFYEGVLGYARLSGISEQELVRTCAAMPHDADVCETARIDSR